MTIPEGNNEKNNMEAAGLTWRGLASRLGRKDRRRLELRIPAGPGQQRHSGGNGDYEREGEGS